MPIVIRRPDGSFNVDTGDTPLIRIDIEDIDKVTFFKRTTENEVTTAEINFVGDGSFFIQYKRSGKLLAFRGERIGMQVHADGRVVLRAFDPGMP